MIAGQIRSEEAYAHGKMLDNSGWRNAQKYGERILPRLITPSDIDTIMDGSNVIAFPVVFDNGGKMLLCELSRVNTEWVELSRGQRWLYESVVRGTAHCAVLCRHNVAPEDGRKIDTREDVESFQLLLDDHGIVCSRVVEGNMKWQGFVLGWFGPGREALRIRRRVLGASEGMISPKRTR